jgi:anti-anti-sigma factor
MLSLHPIAEAADPPASSAPSCRTAALGVQATIAVTANDQGPASVAVTGELDLASAEGLASALCGALDEHASGLLLDLAGVEFFDCAALHALEHAQRHAERCGRSLVLEKSSASVDLILESAGRSHRPAA